MILPWESLIVYSKEGTPCGRTWVEEGRGGKGAEAESHLESLVGNGNRCHKAVISGNFRRAAGRAVN
jgi:hypothetical protein